ncbi:MAG: hypothetical protein ACOC1U_09840 [Spirochaetota bacterium]
MGTRKLCSWGRTRIRKKTDKLLALVTEPTHLCMKCGRVANGRKYLCVAAKLEDVAERS